MNGLRQGKARAAAVALASALWPPVCVICGRAGDTGQDWCAGCAAALPVPRAQCARCGAVVARPTERCGACIQAPPPFDRTEAAFTYVEPVTGLVQRFKFNRDPVAGRVLAELTAHRLAAVGAVRPDLMVPVPLFWRREWERGFNQAEWLCRDLQRLFAGPPWTRALSRRRATAAQSDLPAARRRGNVRGAFDVRRLPAGVRHVALVDDVMTTGSTLAECARVLKSAGVARVDVWVAARA